MGYQPTFYGTSLDVTLWKAATALGREPNSLRYRAEERADGQFKVVVLDAPEIEGEAPAPEPFERPIRRDEESQAATERRIPAGAVPQVPEGLPAEELATTVLTELLRRVGTSATLRAERSEDAVRIELKGCDEALLLGRDGRLLDSLQYLVTRIVQHKERGGPSVFLDVEGQREQRAKNVAAMALRLADKVRDVGNAVRIEGATSADRRLIHNALADRRDVRTESEGAGAFRYLVIEPSAR